MTEMQNGPNPKPAFLLQTGGDSGFPHTPQKLRENACEKGDSVSRALQFLGGVGEITDGIWIFD